MEMNTHDFFGRLLEKNNQKTQQLLQNLDKENINRQHIAITRIGKSKRIKTNTSIISLQHKTPVNWYLDCRDNKQQENTWKIVHKWLCFEKGVVPFSKIIDQQKYSQEISSLIEKYGLQTQTSDKKAIIIKLWSTQDSLVNLLLQYIVPLLSFGKGTWSLAALTSNRRFDLLSLNNEGSVLWKGQQPLSKVQLEKEQLMKRVFGFSVEKQKEISQHELLAKLVLPSNHNLYLIVRNISMADVHSNAQLFIEQQITIENISCVYSLAIIRPDSKMLLNNELLQSVLMSLGLKIKKQEEMNKGQREQYLKCVIQQLQEELQGKQIELQHYRTQEVTEDLPIPSERISMGQQHYQHLKRRIKEGKIL